jgi:hypothetical protein
VDEACERDLWVFARSPRPDGLNICLEIVRETRETANENCFLLKFFEKQIYAFFVLRPKLNLGLKRLTLARSECRFCIHAIGHQDKQK